MNDKTINNDVTIAGRESVLASRYRIIKQLGQGGMGSYLVDASDEHNLDGNFYTTPPLTSRGGMVYTFRQ